MEEAINWLDALPPALFALVMVAGVLGLVVVARVLAWLTWPLTRAGREFRR